ncbi:hypothetical protein BKA93DRAFT_479503 [Sparassis latifolia]
MFPCRLLFSLVFGWTAFRRVASMPFTSYAVELATCYSAEDVQAVADQCAAVCQPVLDAQDCNRNAACTCSTAPPSAVNACIQCHVGLDKEVQPREIALLIPSRLNTYSRLCGQAPTIHDYPIVDALLSVQNSTLDRRAVVDIHCIYGLPDVATTGITVLVEGQRKVWPLYAVMFVVMFFAIERWRRSYKLSSSA